MKLRGCLEMVMFVLICLVFIFVFTHWQMFDGMFHKLLETVVSMLIQGV